MPIRSKYLRLFADRDPAQRVKRRDGWDLPATLRRRAHLTFVSLVKCRDLLHKTRVRLSRAAATTKSCGGPRFLVARGAAHLLKAPQHCPYVFVTLSQLRVFISNLRSAKRDRSYKFSKGDHQRQSKADVGHGDPLDTQVMPHSTLRHHGGATGTFAALAGLQGRTS